MRDAGRPRTARRWSAPGRRRSAPGPGAPARRGPGRRHTGAANWLWPPGRRRNMTSQRATVSATSTPWSSSTRASATSMPAVTPADVHTSPSRVQIGSASTSTSGCSAARRVGAGPVGRRPPAVEQAGGGEQERPAAHADDAAGAGGERRRSAATSSASSTAAVARPMPPGTSSVSTVGAGRSAGGDELQPALGSHGPGLSGDDLDLVAGRPAAQRRAAGAGEDLVRPGDVERLHAVVGDDHDAAGGPGPSVDARADGVKDADPTNPAITPGAVPTVTPGAAPTHCRRVLSGGCHRWSIPRAVEWVAEGPRRQ